MLDEDFDYLLKKDLAGNASSAEIGLLLEQILRWREALREKRVGIAEYQHTLKMQLEAMEVDVQEKNDAQVKLNRKIGKLGTKINCIDSRLNFIRAILREQVLTRRRTSVHEEMT